MSPDTLENLLQQADISARRGDWQETFTTLFQAAELKPNHVGALTGLGTSLIHLDRLSEAIPYLQRVVDLAPESSEAHNNLGVVFALTGELSSAERAYKAAVDLDPDHVAAWKNLAQIYLKQEDRLLEGVQILAAVIQSSPEDVEAQYILAQCYEIGEDNDSAMELYTNLLKIQPDHPEALEALNRLEQPRRFHSDQH
jgi:tetratricopeptide (TPR) repeat protein